MLERKAERLYRRGEITSEVRETVRATNGHNDHITRDFYLLNSRRDEQRTARRFSQLLTGHQGEDDSDTQDLVPGDVDSDEEEDADPLRYQRLWGTKHPDQRQGNKIRVEWSTSELTYIRRFESKLRNDAKRDGISADKVLKTLASR